MDYQTLLNTATEIGYLLLQNGAETYRVEDSVNYVLMAYDIVDFSVFAIPSCIIVSLTTDCEQPITKSKRVLNRSLNIDRIVSINSLCRYITANKPSLSYINEELEKINRQINYPFVSEMIANSLAASAFTIFYGGNLRDALCSVLIGALIRLTTRTMKRFRMNSFTTITLNSFIISLFAILLTTLGLGVQYDRIIIGCFMLLVPGVAITNAARDFIAGDLLSGSIRLIEAFLVATSIALGSGIALSIFR